MRKCQAELSDIARIFVISFVSSFKCECQAECVIFCYVDKNKYARKSKNMYY